MTDPDTLGDSAPGQALIDYLALTGWTARGEDPRGVTVFTHRVPERDQPVVVAVSADAEPENVSRAIETIAYVEGRDTSEVRDDLVFGGSDTLAAQLLPQLPTGQAPLLLVESAITSMRNLLTGAVQATEAERSVARVQAGSGADAWLRRARLSTAPGSFILNVACPLYDVAESPQAVDDPPLSPSGNAHAQPYGRAITSQLHGMVSRAVAGANLVLESRGVQADLAAELGNTNIAVLEGLGGSAARSTSSTSCGSHGRPVPRQT